MMKTRSDEECELVRVSLAEARNAQASWALQPMPARMDSLRELRHLVAAHATELASTAAVVSGRPLAEKLASEVLPLADACLWLERCTSRVLAPRRCGKEGRPFWMRGMRRGKWRPHFDELGADAAQLFSSYILAVHGKGRRRIGALRELVSVSVGNSRYRKATTCKK